MKLNSVFKNIIGAALLTASVNMAYAAENYTFDPSHSYVLFKIKHFDFSEQVGKWYITGNMTLDKNKPENSKVSATIDINKVVTGIPELDKHIKNKSFFNVQQFPKATFESDKVDVLSDKTATVYGKLTIRGVTKPVVLNVILNKAGVSPLNNQNTVGFNATTHLKRSDFGMTAYLPGLSDQVDVSIGVEANQPKQKDVKHANE